MTMQEPDPGEPWDGSLPSSPSSAASGGFNDDALDIAESCQLTLDDVASSKFSLQDYILRVLGSQMVQGPEGAAGSRLEDLGDILSRLDMVTKASTLCQSELASAADRQRRALARWERANRSALGASAAQASAARGELASSEEALRTLGTTARGVQHRLSDGASRQARALEAQRTLVQLQQFSLASDLGALPAPFDDREGNAARAAVASARLAALARGAQLAAPPLGHRPAGERGSGNGGGPGSGPEPGSLEAAVESLELFCNVLDNRLVSRFDQACALGDVPGMAACARGLTSQAAGQQGETSTLSTLSSTALSSPTLQPSLPPWSVAQLLARERVLAQRFIASRPIFSQPPTEIPSSPGDTASALRHLRGACRSVLQTAIDEAAVVERVFSDPGAALGVLVQRLAEERVAEAAGAVLRQAREDPVHEGGNFEPARLGPRALGPPSYGSLASSGADQGLEIACARPEASSVPSPAASSAQPSLGAQRAYLKTLASVARALRALASDLQKLLLAAGKAAAPRLGLDTRSGAGVGYPAREDSLSQIPAAADLVEVALGSALRSYLADELAWLAGVAAGGVAPKGVPLGPSPLPPTATPTSAAQGPSMAFTLDLCAAHEEASARCVALAPGASAALCVAGLFAGPSEIGPGGGGGAPPGLEGAPWAAGALVPALQRHLEESTRALGAEARAWAAGLDVRGLQERGGEGAGAQSSASPPHPSAARHAAACQAFAHMLVHHTLKPALQAASTVAAIAGVARGHAQGAVLPHAAADPLAAASVGAGLAALRRAADAGVGRALGCASAAFQEGLLRVLRAAQRPGPEFKPDPERGTRDVEAATPAAQCAAGAVRLAGEEAAAHLHGPNAAAFVEAVGEAAVRAAREHFAGCSFSALGGLRYRRDLQALREALRQAGATRALAAVQRMEELASLLVVPAEALPGLLGTPSKEAAAMLAVREDAHLLDEALLR